MLGVWSILHGAGFICLMMCLVGLGMVYLMCLRLGSELHLWMGLQRVIGFQVQGKMAPFHHTYVDKRNAMTYHREAAEK